MILRYLHRPHRARHVAASAHPVPELIEIVDLIVFEQADAHRIHTRRAAVGLDLLPRPSDEALRNVKRLYLRSRSVHQFLPFRVDIRSIWPARPLRSSPITGPSPLLRAVPPLCPAVLCPSRFLPLGVLPLRGQQAKFGHSGWPPVSGRQVLLFHASACDELTPPLHRAPPGPHAGRSLAEGTP